MKVDTHRINRRRHELGLSVRVVGTTSGIGRGRAHQLLAAGGADHGTLTLAEVERLADTLGLRPLDLIDVEQSETQPSDTNNAVATLVALLQAANDYVSLTGLARATGMTLAETTAVLAEAETQLTAVGQRVYRHTNDGTVCIMADTGRTSDEAIAIILRDKQARLQLNVSTAKLVYRILDGHLTQRDLSTSTDLRLRLGELINAGVVAEPQHEREQLRLTEDSLKSLLITPD